MSGDSKLLTLAALGVIGLGSAMPYWSAWTTEPSATTEANVADYTSDANQHIAPRADLQAYWDQQVSRPEAVTLTPRAEIRSGLDNPANIPSFTSGHESTATVAAHPIQAEVPISQVGSVSLASRVEAMDAPSHASQAVVPIEIPGSAGQLPPTTTSPEIRRVSKPQLPEEPLRQQFVPLPRIAPPQHGAATSDTAPTEHQVRDGDSLETLAEKYLGDARFASAIYQANRAQLDSPDLLPIGSKLKIPAVPAKASSEASAQEMPLTRLKPVSPAEMRGPDHPWTNLAPPGQS